MLVLSESFHVFESRIACRCNRFPSRKLLFLFDISSHNLLDICWTCSYPLSCTLTLWQKICQSEQMTLISEYSFSTKDLTNSGSKYFKSPSHKQIVLAAGPRIDLMSTKMLFYIVKGFGLIKRGMRVKWKCNQGSSSKAACHEKKKLTCHQGIIKLVL
jgi:hypothetical protein